MKVVRWLVAWSLYWLGDIVSRWNDNDVRFTKAGFHLYQWLMLTSSKVQGPTDFGPWRSAERRK